MEDDCPIGDLRKMFGKYGLLFSVLSTSFGARNFMSKGTNVVKWIMFARQFFLWECVRDKPLDFSFVFKYGWRNGT